MKVLIAEDDKAMSKIVMLYFERDGYEVTTAFDGLTAFDFLCTETFDLAILDWMMPGMDGVTLCQEIRKLRISVKTILLTAKSTTEDELLGLESGADEYIRKPFEPKILLLRAKKLLKLEEVLVNKTISLNQLTKKAFKSREELQLSKKEFDLLEYFLHNQGVILTRDMLLNHVWGLDYDGEDRTVDTHIKRLRSKIGGDIIVTYRGIGYCMEKQL